MDHCKLTLWLPAEDNSSHLYSSAPDEADSHSYSLPPADSQLYSLPPADSHSVLGIKSISAACRSKYTVAAHTRMSSNLMLSQLFKMDCRDTPTFDCISHVRVTQRDHGLSLDYHSVTLAHLVRLSVCNSYSTRPVQESALPPHPHLSQYPHNIMSE